MTDAKSSARIFLTDQHRQCCFEAGDHPDEVDTAYSIGAYAIARPVTVAEAAKVLLDVFEDPMQNAPDGFDWQSMYDEMTADHKESMDIGGTHDWPSTLVVALRALSHEAADTIDAQAATIKTLVEALECIDSDLESRNFLENSSLRDTTRAAIAAARGVT